MNDFKIDEAVWREMARKSLDTMDSINKKWCQEELERIKAGTATDTNFDCSNCQLADCDPKTAFLTELQILLRKYDAKIHVWAGDDGDKVLIFELKDNIDICYPNEWCTDYKFEFPITPDNIFNYDKE